MLGKVQSELQRLLDTYVSCFLQTWIPQKLYLLLYESLLGHGFRSSA